MTQQENQDGVAENPETQNTNDTGHAKTLMVNARLRVAADMLQDLAYDLADAEPADVIAEIIQMSALLHRLLERREAA